MRLQTQSSIKFSKSTIKDPEQFDTEPLLFLWPLPVTAANFEAGPQNILIFLIADNINRLGSRTRKVGHSVKRKNLI
jgi:hypothetical protein